MTTDPGAMPGGDMSPADPDPLDGDPAGERRRLERSLAVAEASLMKLATATQHKSRWRVATATFARAEALVRLGRHSDGLAACEQIIAHYGEAPDAPTQVLVAGALVYRGAALGGLGDPAADLAADREVIRRFPAPADPALAELVAAARGRMGAAITIRNVDAASPAELAAVVVLIERAFIQYLPELEPAFIERWQRDARAIETRAAEAQVLVAELPGSLAGTVTLYLDGADYRMPGWPETTAAIRYLAVDPESRGAGAGRRLTAACVDRARSSGIPAIGLHTAPFMTAAQAVYSRLGFAREPSLDVTFPGGPAPALAYVLSLD
jgi:ribosomal protein S18 acetylase RimI-like enzyme